MHPYLDHPGPLAIAHQGGALEAAGNSMAAFRHAHELGYRYLETDVRLSSDGVVVVFHDPVLDRMTDRVGRIEALPWSELEQVRIAGTEPILRLVELVEAFPDCRINIDAKSDAVVDPLLDVVEKTGAEDRVCLAAFSGRRLDRMRQRLPSACTAAAPGEVARIVAGRPAGVKARCAQVPVRRAGVPVVTRRMLATARAADIAVHVWTIDDPDEMERLLELGVDGIMTDRPAVLRRVLETRGEWVD